MKIKIALLSLSMVSFAAADATIYITGATAFRTAAINAIAGSFTGAFTAGYNSGSLRGGSLSAFKGSISGISGTTRIYCAWNGSVEGIKAIHNADPLSFLAGDPPATPAGVSDGTGGGIMTTTELKKAQFAFSDVSSASTPYTTNTLYPGLPAVGVIAFSWMINNGGNANVDGITSQTASALIGNGALPLSAWTSQETDRTSHFVYLTGRNDGSGTRTTVFAESGFSISALAKQWKPTVSGGSTSSISTLQLWPTGDVVAGPPIVDNRSTVWNVDTDGNGGFSSGGSITASMRATSSLVQRKTASGTNLGGQVALTLVGYQSASDAFASQAAGTPGRLLKYNGADALTYVTTPSNSLSPGAIASIVQGKYTLWGYENLYSILDLDDSANLDAKNVYDKIKAGCTATNLGLSGVELGLMKVGRSQDGGTVAP